MITMVGLLSTSGRTQEASDPWWVQGYTTSAVTETSYAYDENNVATKTTSAINSTVTFYDKKKPAVSVLENDERRVYNFILELKNNTSDIRNNDLAEKLFTHFSNLDPAAVNNALGYYFFETATGFYAYLNAAPPAKEVAVYDAWFEFYKENFPTPPKTAEELERINTQALETISKKFEASNDEIRNIIHKMEKYQDKYNLPRAVPLSTALEQMTQS